MHHCCKDMLNHSAPDVQPLNVTKSNYSRLPTDSVWWKPLPNQSIRYPTSTVETM